MQDVLEAALKPVLIEDDQNGIVRFSHAGKSITLQFHWGVIAGMQKEYGKPGYLRITATGIQERDVLVLADLISRASGIGEKREGAMTTIDVMRWSPPLVSMCEAVQTGWLLALYGPAMKPAEEAEGDEKKKKARATSFLWRLAHLFGLASHGTPSGVSPPTSQTGSPKDTPNGSMTNATQLH